MSKREEILKAICKATVATMDDLLTALPDMARKQIADNLQAAATDGLIKRERDDVTNTPCYRLTDLGRKRLESGPSKQINKRGTPAGGGAHITGSQASASRVAGGSKRTDPSTEGLTVVEQPKQDKAPAKACSDESGVILTLKKRIDQLEETASRQEERGDALGRAIVGFCEWLHDIDGGRVPMNLTECKTIISKKFDEWIAWRNAIGNISGQDTPENAAANIAGLRKRIAQLEANERLPLETATNSPSTADTAIDMLDKAGGHMKARASTYDKPEGERSMTQTVAIFNQYHGTNLTEAQGWHFQQVLKDVRLFSRPGYHADSAEDCIAYAALKAEAKQMEAA